MQLDKERLEKLAPQLSAHNIDPQHMPEPGSGAWRTMVRELSLHDPVLAQHTAGLVYDPAELNSGDLVNQQIKSTQARGSIGRLLTPLLQTQTANGDPVPNTTLIRSVLIGGGLLAAAGLYVGLPHSRSAVPATATSSTSTSGQSTSTTGKPPRSPAIPQSTSTTSTSGTAGVTDTTASPASSTSEADPVFGSVEPQAAPDVAPVQANSVSPVSLPSDPTGFAPASRMEPSSTPTSRIALGRTRPQPSTAQNPAQRTPRATQAPTPPSAAAPRLVRLTPATPRIPVAPKPHLIALTSGSATAGAANGTGATGAASAPIRRLVASGSTPASGAAGTRERGLKSSAATSATVNGAAEQATSSPRGRALNTSAAAPSTQVVALKVIAPVTAPPAVQLVTPQSAPTSAPTADVQGRSRTPGTQAAGADGGQQSVTLAQGRPGLSSTAANANPNGADPARYGLHQSGRGDTGGAQPASAAPDTAGSGRQAVGLLRQGQGQTAAPTSSPSSGAPGNATPVVASYGLEGLGPTRNTPVTSTAPASPAPALPAAASSTAAAGSSPSPAAVAPTPSAPPYPVGEPLSAKLVLGVAAVDGAQSTVPVFATTGDGATWRGTATLDGRKRLQIQFSAVLRNGAEQAITADAYGSDGQPGLAASVRVTTPTLAADLLSGVLGGIKAFADATVNQRNVSVQAGTGNTGNVVTSTSANTPNFWLVTAGNALGQFQVPQNKATVVTVAEVKAGTALSLVVRGDSR